MVSEWFSSVFLLPSFLVLCLHAETAWRNLASCTLTRRYKVASFQICNEAAVDPDCGLPLFLITPFLV